MTDQKTWPATFEEWLHEQLDEEQRRELAEHGADAGWPGLIYTSECVEVHDQYEEELWDWLHEDAEEMGADNVAAFMGAFRRSDMLNDPHQMKNLVVWYGAERLCHLEQND